MLALNMGTNTPVRMSQPLIYTLPFPALRMLLPLGLDSHICALSVHFGRLRLQGKVEMKDLPLPACILFLLATGLHSGSSIWFHFAKCWLPCSPNQLHHTPSEFPTPTSWPKSPEVCMSLCRDLQRLQNPQQQTALSSPKFSLQSLLVLLALGR